MSTETLSTAHGENKVNYLNAAHGIKSWLLTKDHKRIAILYLWSIMLMFLFGGLLALFLRLELLGPGPDLIQAKTYNQLFTLHGAIMIFMFIIPSVPAILGNFALPIQIGAKDVAFPRLNLASWYFYIIGSGLAVYAILAGSVDTGWTFYTPYSTQTTGAVITMVFAIFILGFSSIFTGLNFIATIHKLRAPGITWYKMPLFVWGIYATGIIQVLATPVLGITLVLLILERAFGIGIFDPAMGGDPVLFQHFFWFYSHPAVYIMILPGMGIISELVSTFSHRKIFGFKPIAYSSIAIAFLSFGVWGHHMFVSGQSQYATLIFSFLTFLVAIPSGVKMFNWVSTMYKGAITFETPMLFTLSFFFTFAIGGLTGIFLGATAVDVHVTDTYFVVAHFHYVMMGGTIMAFFGGLYYWWPKIWGRMYNEAWGQASALLVFVGFNFTFFPMFIMGTQGMPRRYFLYPEKYQILQVLSTGGSWILGLGLLIMAAVLLHAIKWGKKAGKNPWGALTLEWMVDSPPAPHNFEQIPTIEFGPYDHDKVLVEPDRAGAVT
ncbi:MAG TPA: cytochrome c oxidase subunit I [bacterium]|nr:cytochrome c oxidase subunit I [bacterium]